jgi:hypothetical protein
MADKIERTIRATVDSIVKPKAKRKRVSKGERESTLAEKRAERRIKKIVRGVQRRS